MTIELERRAFVQAGSRLPPGRLWLPQLRPRRRKPRARPRPRPSRTFDVKPMPFDPGKIKGLSEKILTSHYANNYTGAVKRLNQITEQLAGLDYAKAPGYLINGLKREELTATNSMILHEVTLRGSVPEKSRPGPTLAEALAHDFGSFQWWRGQFVAMGKAEGGGSGWVLLAGTRATSGWSTPGRPTTRRPWPAASRSSRSTCTSMPIRWITVPKRATMSRRS